MAYKSLTWPSVLSFVLVWVFMSFLTWGLVCLFAIVFLYSILQAGLIPAEVLLVLWLIPISGVTLLVQTALFVIGRFRWPDSAEANKRLVLFCTPLVTWLVLVLFTLLSGGADSFVPRL